MGPAGYPGGEDYAVNFNLLYLALCALVIIVILAVLGVI